MVSQNERLLADARCQQRISETGLVSRERLERALEIQRFELECGLRGQPLADVLLKLGYITPAEWSRLDRPTSVRVPNVVGEDSDRGKQSGIVRVVIDVDGSDEQCDTWHSWSVPSPLKRMRPEPGSRAAWGSDTGRLVPV